jgi:5-hydroxytryptamine receptor 7
VILQSVVKLDQICSLLFLFSSVFFFFLGPSDNLPICQVNSKLDYQIFATMLSFYIPLIVVLIIYANIYRTAQTAMDNRSSVQMSQFLSHNNSSNNVTPASALAQQKVNGNSCSSPQLLLNVSNAANAHVPDDSSCLTDIEPQLGGRRMVKRSTETKPKGLLSTSRCLRRRISTPFNGRLSIFVTRRYSLFRHVHLPNQKAIRTLGVILGTFIVCWLPFMLFAIIKPLHEYVTRLTSSQRSLNAPVWVDPVLLWFGYSSSMLNPLIYSKFNREFRTPFREIICCRCRGLNEKIRRQEYLENLCGDQYLSAPPAHLHIQQQHTGTAHPRSSGSFAAAV